MELFSKKTNIDLIKFIVPLCAILVGVIYIVPHIVGYLELKNYGLKYYPLSLEAGRATDYFDELNDYVPSVREVWEGHWPLANADIYEYREGPMKRHALASMVLSPFLYLTKDITSFFILSDFIFAIISFGFLYSLAFLLTKNKPASLFFSIIISLSPLIALDFFPLDLASLKDLAKHFVIFNIDIWTPHNSNLVKMEAMKPGLPFLLGFLAFLYLTIKRKRRYDFIFCGILGGSLFYIYSFYWVFAVLMIGVLLIALFLSKDYLGIKRIFLAGSIMCFLSLPYWYYYLWESFLPHHREMIEVAGGEISRLPRWDKWPEYLLYIVLAITTWRFYKKDNRAVAIFMSSLLLTAVVIYNFQIITGFQVQSKRWPMKVTWVILAFAWLLIITKIFKLVGNKKCFKWAKIASIIIAMLLTFNAFTGKLIWASTKFPYWTLPDSAVLSFKWLEENTPLDSVIMTPSLVTNRYLINYTNNKIYLPYAERASPDEILDRLYIIYKLFNVPEKYFNDVFFLDKRDVMGPASKWANINFHEQRGIMNVYSFKYAQQPFTREDAEKIVNKYKNYSIKNLKFILNKYRVDYIYYGPLEKKINAIDLTQYSFLDKIYDREQVQIYKVNSREKVSK